MRRTHTVFALALVGVQGFECPPVSAPAQGVNHQCGGTCHSAGQCADGLVCQANCKSTKEYTGIDSDFDIFAIRGASSAVGRCAPASAAAAAAAAPTMCAGCAIDASVCATGVVDATAFALSAIDAQSNSLNSLQLVRPGQFAGYQFQAETFAQWLLASPRARMRGSGVFLASCPGHVIGHDRRTYHGAIVGGVAMSDAIKRWYDSDGDDPAEAHWHVPCELAPVLRARAVPHLAASCNQSCMACSRSRTAGQSSSRGYRCGCIHRRPEGASRTRFGSTRPACAAAAPRPDTPKPTQLSCRRPSSGAWSPCWRPRRLAPGTGL